MKLESSYKDGERIPGINANIGVEDGENLSPPFKWDDEPKETKSFALVMVDHNPVAREFVHWLVVNIPADVTSIKEGASGTDKMPVGAEELNSSYMTSRYGGPRPPAGTGDHPYETTVYALSFYSLDLNKNTTIDEFQSAINGKILAKASLTGLLSR